MATRRRHKPFAFLMATPGKDYKVSHFHKHLARLADEYATLQRHLQELRAQNSHLTAQLDGCNGGAGSTLIRDLEPPAGVSVARPKGYTPHNFLASVIMPRMPETPPLTARDAPDERGLHQELGGDI